jgi:hypothetical protein
VNPGSPDCTSCWFALSCDVSFPGCERIKADANCKALGTTPTDTDGPRGYAGFYPPEYDSLMVRFHRMKERFGVDPQYPIARYVRALTKRRVPKRTTDHDKNGNYVDGDACQNPLFAAALPASSQEELCNLPDGARSRQLLFFGLIGGVPKSLSQPVVAADDWTKLLGANPDAYDFTGIDPHMIQSVAPRPGLPGPSAKPGDNGTDPDHGREWDTEKSDLQYACTFDLPAARVCDPWDPSCECRHGENPPLCGSAVSSSEVGTKIKGKAYPTVRELRLVKALGDRAAAGSLCSVDRQSGYGPMLHAFADRIGIALAK